jgi:hypothetical protein
MASMDDPRIKQLDWLQAIIARMASNSFLLKGWAVTITAALLALSAKDSDRTFAVLAIYPALVFWGLDAYYLQLERSFRAKFEAIAGPLGLGLSVKQTAPAQASQPAAAEQPRLAALRSYLAVCFAAATWPIYVAILVVAGLNVIRASVMIASSALHDCA